MVIGWVRVVKNWTRYFSRFQVDKNKSVHSLCITIVNDNTEGKVSFTDIMLQEGDLTSGYMTSNKEMLAKEVINNEEIAIRHFNAVIRGKQSLGIPNRALPVEEVNLNARTTGGMDFTIYATSYLPPEGVKVDQYYGTRPFYLRRELNQGDTFQYKASRRELLINDQRINQSDVKYQQIPAISGKFNIELQQEGRPGSGYVLCEVETWLKGKGSERL